MIPRSRSSHTLENVTLLDRARLLALTVNETTRSASHRRSSPVLEPIAGATEDDELKVAQDASHQEECRFRHVNHHAFSSDSDNFLFLPLLSHSSIVLSNHFHLLTVRSDLSNTPETQSFLQSPSITLFPTLHLI
ncbi:hypothetical protein ADUPG1_000414 [Aduncisulcus paluster]|uniref:Uncharacterized protein n=1 Tax=Aduncisulcus paluster TaxID=2918883 RepID=A0ABQ5K9D3_9EUKA|nr:hypothetical protein ADUPG1_000414 [Aduncisulcus paluster]